MHSKGEKVTAKAHGGPIDITGITVATVNDKVQLQDVNTYFDPLEMFRQIAPNGIVNKQVIDKKIHSVDKAAALDPTVPSHDGVKIAEEHNTSISTDKSETGTTEASCPVSGASMSAALSGCPVMNLSRSNSNSSGSAWEKVSNPNEEITRSVYSSSVTGNVEERIAAGGKVDSSKAAGVHDDIDEHLEKSADTVHPHPKLNSPLESPL